MKSVWQSCAQWPKGTLWGTDVSKDNHGTREQAQAVCDMLNRDGLGGEHKVFPVKTWVEEET